MRISDWSSDVCSSDLRINVRALPFIDHVARPLRRAFAEVLLDRLSRSIDSLPQLGDHLGDAKPTVIMKGGEDRKSVVSGTSVSVRVVLGGRRIIKKTNKTKSNTNENKE